MNNASLSIYALLLIIGLNSIICFIIRVVFSRKPKEYTYTIAACIAVFLAILIFENVKRYTGVDLMISGDLNKNWGSRTYAIFMLAIPICIAIPIYIYSRIYPNKIPSNGTWYCEELQVGLCFDESGSSFVVKDQKPFRVDWRLEAKADLFIYSPTICLKRAYFRGNSYPGQKSRCGSKTVTAIVCTTLPPSITAERGTVLYLDFPFSHRGL